MGFRSRQGGRQRLWHLVHDGGPAVSLSGLRRDFLGFGVDPLGRDGLFICLAGRLATAVFKMAYAEGMHDLAVYATPDDPGDSRALGRNRRRADHRSPAER